MKLSFAVAAALLLTAGLVPATASAQGETLDQKDCVLSAASLLPTIPGLEIVDAEAKPDASPNAYMVRVTIKAIDRTATYEFTCIHDPVDGALVEGGRLVR